MDEKEYLLPDFDPNKLTIPKLRSILLDHDVSYPSSAKKSELVSLFEKNVGKNAASLLKKHKMETERPVEDIELASDRESKTGAKETKRGRRTKTPSREPSQAPESPPRVESSLPLKRELEDETPKKKKKALRKRKDDSVVSDDGESPSASRISSTSHSKKLQNSVKSPLRVEKFEGEVLRNSSLDVSSAILNFASGTNTPARKKKPSEILESYNKLNSSGKVRKAPKKTKTKTKTFDEDRLKNKTKDETASDLEAESSAFEEYVSEYSGANASNNEINTTKDATDTKFFELESSLRLEKMSPVSGQVQVPIHVPDEVPQTLNGPTRVIPMDSFNDDERTIKDMSLEADESQGGKLESTEVCEVLSQSSDEAKTDVEEVANMDEEVEILEKTVEVTMEEVQPKVVSKKSFSLLTGILILSVFAVLIPGLLYRQMIVNVGYCGTNAEPLNLGKWVAADSAIAPYVKEFETMVEKFQPECMRCPEHASCYANSRIECQSEYLLHRPWYSLFGLVPNTETCAYDDKRLEKIRLLTEYTMELLRRRDGRELSLDELHNFLKATKTGGMSDSDFEEYWLNFINYEITKEPEIKLDFQTSSISIENKVPTQFYTRIPGSLKTKKMKLFQRYPVPSSTFEGFSQFQQARATGV